MANLGSHPKCMATRAFYNYYYCLYQREQCNRAFTVFITAYNQCNRILENTKSNYAQAVQAKIENKKLGLINDKYIMSDISKAFYKCATQTPQLWHYWESFLNYQVLLTG